MVTIYDIIESDHALARQLLDRIATARSPDWRQSLCGELLQVVQVHGEAKRIAFYDALPLLPALTAQIARQREAQDIAESYLKEAAGVPADSPQFLRLFHEVRAELEQAMQAEVMVLFAEAQGVIDELAAIRMGQRMRQLKDDFIEADYLSNLSLRADAGYFA